MPLDLAKIEDSSHLLDVLIQMEDVLDSLDIYVYKNWFSGEIVAGPVISRHWASFTLLYPYLKMPDPSAAYRLIKHGIRVTFSKVARETDQTAPAEGKKKQDSDESRDWLVEIRFPRRLLSQISGVDLDLYADDVDVGDVEDANDDGIDDESGYMADEQGAPGQQDPTTPNPGADDAQAAS